MDSDKDAKEEGRGSGSGSDGDSVAQTKPADERNGPTSVEERGEASPRQAATASRRGSGDAAEASRDSDGEAAQERRSVCATSEEDASSGRCGDAAGGADWGRGDAPAVRVSQKRRLPSASLDEGADESAGTTSSCREESLGDSGPRKKSAHAPLSDAYPQPLEPHASKEPAPLGAPGGAASASSQFSGAGRASRGPDRESLSSSPADGAGADAYHALAFAAAHASSASQMEQKRSQQLRGLEKAFDAFMASHDLEEGRRPIAGAGAHSSHSGPHHQLGSAYSVEHGGASSSSSADYSRAELEELCRQSGMASRDVSRLLGSVRSVSGKSPDEFRKAAASWARQQLPASALGPGNLASDEGRLYLQRAAALDQQKRLRDRWAAGEAAPGGRWLPEVSRCLRASSGSATVSRRATT
ncbi:AP2 domain transcription factor AP2XII-1 [Besnoitia besnoiti]|uniref:AP2 domain transcription factor AP2XII-1 n=1 Tax=Besnoitia besnoiti TaxID=94643 RepID=A0A2A9MMZ0_BESBE|nr:AP2 domain transcription factor AP2XII-1 [Besnoitia besnoiti]PFH37516.1 AP2 domain transcription factor AP2XII-1 [Besnoitia besnoiti]